MTKIFKYGSNNTFHRDEEVDVEVDKNGKVVSVWFRCMQLPFKQINVNVDRAKSIKSSDKPFNIDSINFIEE